MKTIIFSLMLIFCSNVFAEASLHAHEHGSIALEMAVEGKTANFSVDGPAESFLGFEYLPKTAKDKKVFAEAKNLWTKKFFDLVFFDKRAGCTIIESVFEQKIDGKEKNEGGHSDIEASTKITCAQDLKGMKLKINLKKYFKNIKKLKLDIIGNETKSLDVNSESFEAHL